MSPSYSAGYYSVPEKDYDEMLTTIARYKRALEAIVATDVPKIDEGEFMAEIAQEALDA